MRMSSLRHGLCLLLAATMLPGSSLLASETVPVRSADYSLDQNGTLVGSVLNQSARPVTGLRVDVLHHDRVVATAISDEKGRFAVSGLRNGTHSVQIGESKQQVRFWSTDAAPPTAVSRMAIVVDDEVVRGQASNNNGLKTVGKLILIGGAVATTLALTLDNNNNDSAPASP